MRTQVSPAVAAVIVAVVLAVVAVLAWRAWTAVEKPPAAPTSLAPPPPGSFSTPMKSPAPAPAKKAR
jgi:cytochrome c-type biogenesis protein CcmH/NrfG